MTLFSVTVASLFNLISPLVFTPLFLGASLFVPAADDIGTPGKLAEWMSRVEATVTHLTPGKTFLTRKCSVDMLSHGSTVVQ
jgi:L-aminoadipate-semialdehyde dehydrogenase